MLDDKIKKDDETKEASSIDRLNYYDQKSCRKKKHGKEYFLCKELERGFQCVFAVKVDQRYYCPRLEKKK